MGVSYTVEECLGMWLVTRLRVDVDTMSSRKALIECESPVEALRTGIDDFERGDEQDG